MAKLSRWQRHLEKHGGKGHSMKKLHSMFLEKNQLQFGREVELDLATNDCERRIEAYLRRREKAEAMIQQGAVKVTCPYCHRESLAHINKNIPTYIQTQCIRCGKPIMAIRKLEVTVKKNPNEWVEE